MRLVTGSVLGGSWQPRRAPFSATAVARRGLLRGGGQTHDELESKFVVATKAVSFTQDVFGTFLGLHSLLSAKEGDSMRKLACIVSLGLLLFNLGSPALAQNKNPW